jgi:hypothetical protein
MNTRNRLRSTSVSLFSSLALVACGQTTEKGQSPADTTSSDSTSSHSTSNGASSSPATGATSSNVTTSKADPSTSSNTTGAPSMQTNSTSTAPTGTSSASSDVSTSSSSFDDTSSGQSDDSSSSQATDTTTTPAEGGYPENTGAGCDVTAGELKSNKAASGRTPLPDPFTKHDGTRVANKAEWVCRRNEIKKDVEKYEIGTKPEPSDVEVVATYDGGNLNVVITNAKGSLTLTSKVAGEGSADCVAIGMNGNSSLINGCVQIPFMHDQVVFQDQNGSRKQGDPFYELYPDAWSQQSSIIGNYMAWSWGISRLIDGIDQVKDELGVDMKKIGVHGCSYAGKMAMFAGAFDERIALTVIQESGGGGINSWRTSEDFVAMGGADIEKIDNTNYSWFMSALKQRDPYSLPHDHHELVAMIAPRAVVALGNQKYEWLGDESGWKSINAAKEVWKALGAEDAIGFDFTTGHNHCQAPSSQSSAVTAFVDKFLKGKDADTNIAVRPQATNLDLDFANVIDWETPTLE